MQEAKLKKVVRVVGAIIENELGQILCALRSSEMSLPNLWEFPGGKIEEGESPFQTIQREIKEELGCNIEPCSEIFDDYTYEYDKVIVNLLTIKARLTSGVPVPIEHAALIWLEPQYLKTLVWAPADLSALDKLTL